MRKITLVCALALNMFCISQSQAQSMLKINEVDYDTPGTDNAEFIELYSLDTVNLSDYHMVLVNGGTSTIYDSIALPSITLNPGAYFVICGNGGNVPNCNLVLTATNDIIQNGSPDAIAVRENLSLNIVDAVSYEGDVAPYVEGTGLPTAQSDNNTDVYFGISRYPDGYDTQNNSTDFIPACITPGTTNANVNVNCQNPSSVQEHVVLGQRMFVFPNPAASAISFYGLPASHSNWEITLSDITGKCVMKIFVPASNKIINTNVSSLNNGMYFVVARNNDAPGFVGKLKLIVQR